MFESYNWECIVKDRISKNKVDACGVCSLRAKANSVLYVHCSKWSHDRCAGVKSVIAKFCLHKM